MADKSTNKATVVSSADGAMVQNNLEILAECYNNRSNRVKGFITDLSQTLNLEQHEASHYGTFETKDGKLVTIRVSNHNASVSFFDENGEEDEISIVVSGHKNKGVLNDGKAHLVEYFYPKQSLERSQNKKLAKKAYSYEATKIELLAGTLVKPEGDDPNTNNSITAANLLNGVEKSYGGGKFFEDYNKIREQFVCEKGDAEGYTAFAALDNIFRANVASVIPETVSSLERFKIVQKTDKNVHGRVGKSKR